METVQMETPREKYLKERERIETSNARANNSFTDDELAKMDGETKGTKLVVKDLDKNMGTTSVPATKKVTMTREDYNKLQANKEAQKAIQMMQNMQKQHLSEIDQKILHGLLEDFDQGIIEDPILIHLIEEKIKSAKDFISVQVETKQLQEDLMKRVTDASNRMIKVRGVMENLDLQLLQRNNKLFTTVESTDEDYEG